MKHPLFLLLFNLIAFTTHAQWLTTGFVTDKNTGEAIASAAVRNTSRQMITTTTRLGAFQIFAYSGDSLIVSCVGYVSQKFVISKTDNKLIVELLPDVKILNEVVVKAWTESRFKQEFLKAEVPEKVKISIEAPPGIWGIPMGDFGRMGHDYATLTPKMTVKGPISIVYDKFSKEAKNKKRLAKAQQAEIRRKQYQQKMDTLWLSRVTDLKGERLGSFLKFCNLSETFVLSVDEYELTVAVRGCLREFLAVRE
ncbi:carboxypeptidase-like regulatory domain-containing protein [Dyadobacter sp. NIV53]|uniref:carboxypeptidase-like regulatory domain-containing protein n=1 Tax=Dyadobacter sp. NIV53 TaxID=2861765 RepID=UPI001C88A299|nr:carboxypeptidase-like regulatory domain-containing protein [Dyadobacter sp. NIV53]